MNGIWDSDSHMVLPGVVFMSGTETQGWRGVTSFGDAKRVRAQVHGSRRGRFYWSLSYEERPGLWLPFLGTITSATNLADYEAARDDCIHAVIGMQMRGELAHGEVPK